MVVKVVGMTVVAHWHKLAHLPLPVRLTPSTARPAGGTWGQARGAGTVRVARIAYRHATYSRVPWQLIFAY